MAYLPFQSRYDKAPETVIRGFDAQAWQGYPAITDELRSRLPSHWTVTVDCYPGVDDAVVLKELRDRLHPDYVIESKDIFFDAEKLTRLMAPFLTEDRVRGRMCYGDLRDFIDPEKLFQHREAAKAAHGTVMIYGFGASLISRGDVLVYADMARWEIQLRYRAGMPNYKQDNSSEDVLRKIKRGFFVEWRIADRHKSELLHETDYYLDTNTAGEPHMVSGRALLAGLDTLTRRPFRLVPYFDPGVWGGQWMKEVCGLDSQAANYAWCFDGVPEENSLFLRYGNVRLQTPAMNLVIFAPRALLGEKTFSRFGAEYPIRFDFLDTMEGQNLSLQVHPDTDYIRRHFGMSYTQDESYYILDAEPEEGCVYLGLKTGVDRDEFEQALESAQTSGVPFDADKYINRFPAKKHDHFLIPAGTVHCSGRGCMVLEVSATPYIFTFKLWDWDRLGLDGRPRPIHIREGKQVIRYERDTAWVRQNLMNRFETLREEKGFSEVKTGLHELEFIETHVLSLTKAHRFHGSGEFAMCNLVAGEAAVIESDDQQFEPYTIHYAETFILPAKLGSYWIRPEKAGDEIRFLKADVRF